MSIKTKYLLKHLLKRRYGPAPVPDPQEFDFLPYPDFFDTIVGNFILEHVFSACEMTRSGKGKRYRIWWINPALTG
jgi:hypothetical protein